MKYLLRMTAVALATLLNYTLAFSQTNGTATPVDGAELIAKLDELSAALAQLDSARFAKIPDAEAKAETLTNRLFELSHGLAEKVDGNRSSSITRAATDLNGALAAAPQALKTLLLQGDESSEALNKLRETILTLGLRKPGLVVRVVEAKFGDTYTGRVSASRWCDATSYLRGKCDRAGSCTLDQNYQDVVCGFNPAPSADLRDRGLYVDYQCVPNIEASFAKDYDPAAHLSTSPFLKKSRAQYVVLRGNGSIVCGAAK
ncbi:hypothetical protein Rleg_5446 (plasmid) [Rhizobium leguminosarum bv. trifolii WSM1325]|uniref:Uncharacterized protein n=1 Tax=Rhizobium leguminosarum bv. trifolii (strain WSM1325) TaxID=395491 RepID=C6B8N0_RHILS|nr:hypothetical protein [Rhizobium leguminosarum]ACS60268.1 hypothetical protein Rleg_5446 [Rhizobium leguminosarum bv. trifolii WSM1325]